MSQPLPMDGQKDLYAGEIKESQDLLKIFYDKEKPVKNGLLGIEYEFFGLNKYTKKPLPFMGEISIENLFEHIIKKTKNSKDRFEPIYDNGHIVALSSKKAIIALEPGGQLEIATLPKNNLSEAIENLNIITKEISQFCKEKNIELLAMGFQPVAKLSEMATVKKSRYDIMWQYMQKLQGHGLDMMKRSCAIQINIDYHDEKDMAEKLKVAFRLSPLLSALYSSSAFKEGKSLKNSSERLFVWKNTDDKRTGIPKIVFEENFGYQQWIDYALNVPMYFIRRNDRYYDVTGLSFLDFMKNGFLGKKATIGDFVDHLTTIFTDVRLRPYIEIRSCDSLPLIYVNALSVFIWMIFYQKNIFLKTKNKLSSIKYEEIIYLRDSVIDLGLKAKYKNQTIAEILLELIDLCMLEVDEVYIEGRNYLQHLVNLLKNDESPSDFIKARFESINLNNNIDELIKYFTCMATDLYEIS